LRKNELCLKMSEKYNLTQLQTILGIYGLSIPKDAIPSVFHLAQILCRELPDETSKDFLGMTFDTKGNEELSLKIQNYKKSKQEYQSQDNKFLRIVDNDVGFFWRQHTQENRRTYR